MTRHIVRAVLASFLLSLGALAWAQSPAPDSSGSSSTPQDIGIYDDETALAMAFGGAWDIRLNRALAVRVNPTMMLTRFDGETQLTQRFSTGLVLWFGPTRGHGQE